MCKCKAITEAGADITADNIEDCQRVGNKGQTIIKFGKRKVLRQVLSVRKELSKVKMSDIDLTGQSILNINQSLCLYYRMLWSKTKTCIKKVRLTAFMCLMAISKKDYKKMLER